MTGEKWKTSSSTDKESTYCALADFYFDMSSGPGQSKITHSLINKKKQSVTIDAMQYKRI